MAGCASWIKTLKLNFRRDESDDFYLAEYLTYPGVVSKAWRKQKRENKKGIPLYDRNVGKQFFIYIGRRFVIVEHKQMTDDCSDGTNDTCGVGTGAMAGGGTCVDKIDAVRG